MSSADQAGEQPDEHQPDERELLKQEIERVREDLGETVEALAAKADVRSQVHDRVEDARTQMKERVQDTGTRLQGKVEEARTQIGSELATQSRLRRSLQGPAVPTGVAAVCAMLLLGSILRRRR